MISGYNLEMLYKHDNAAKRYLGDYWGCGGGGGLCNTWISGLGSGTVLVLGTCT